MTDIFLRILEPSQRNERGNGCHRCQSPGRCDFTNDASSPPHHSTTPTQLTAHRGTGQPSVLAESHSRQPKQGTLLQRVSHLYALYLGVWNCGSLAAHVTDCVLLIGATAVSGKALYLERYFVSSTNEDACPVACGRKTLKLKTCKSEQDCQARYRLADATSTTPAIWHEHAPEQNIPITTPRHIFEINTKRLSVAYLTPVTTLITALAPSTHDVALLRSSILSGLPSVCHDARSTAGAG